MHRRHMNMNQDASPTPATGEWGGVHPILPARVVEGASLANDATDGAPGFQRRFVFGVALFLALTGGVKLAAVLQESRVLGAADPLLPWLNGRQMLFLAAGLELGVAAAVFRKRAARWAPWLILWLVSVFGTYRLGLWAMGFQGHCPCLGHLFARWPGFEAWAARLLLASLAVMGLGSAVCLAHGGRRRTDISALLKALWLWPLMVSCLSMITHQPVATPFSQSEASAADADF